jgi:hypothetical protein
LTFREKFDFRRKSGKSQASPSQHLQETQPTNEKKRKLESQEKNIQFRKFLEVIKGLTFESISMNDRIIAINSQIVEIRKKQAIIAKKREIISYNNVFNN